MSWKPEMLCQGEWVSNALRFPTKEMAEDSARNLYSRWTVPSDWRAVESKGPVEYLYLPDHPSAHHGCFRIADRRMIVRLDSAGFFVAYLDDQSRRYPLPKDQVWALWKYARGTHEWGAKAYSEIANYKGGENASG